MSKVYVRIIGGIGNQLFCYAAARRLALANDAELIIDDVSGFILDKRYRRRYQLDHFNIPCRKANPAERLEPFPRFRRHLMRLCNRPLPFEKRTYITQEGIDYDPRLLTVRVANNLYLEGYWQSENYFKDEEATIRNDLRIKPSNNGTDLAMAQHIRDCRAIAVHVRFFDPPDAPNNINAPRDYYSRAVAEMQGRYPDAHFFLFSDAPEAARHMLNLPEQRITLLSHNGGEVKAWADLWLMTLCRHFIIANSSFSWWGAWLCDGRNKQVIAPGFETRCKQAAWGFKGLLPSNWTRL